MSENILVVSQDTGKTETVKFSEVAEGGSLHTKFFEEFSKKHPDVANVLIKFDGIEGVFDNLDGVQFPLDRAEKTLGTYVTRVNKIVEGVNPSTRTTRSGSGSSSSVKAPVGVEMLNKESVRLFRIDNESEAVVNISGAVETNNYDEMSYFIDAVLHPKKWDNRIAQLRQFTNGKEATPPEYVLEYKGVSIKLGDSKPTDDVVRKAQAEIAAKLFTEGKEFTASELRDAKPKMIGGGEEWLDDWLRQAYPDSYKEKEIETA